MQQSTGSWEEDGKAEAGPKIITAPGRQEWSHRGETREQYAADKTAEWQH